MIDWRDFVSALERGYQFLIALIPIRMKTHDHLKQNESKREDVASLVQAFAGDLLWRHILQGARCGAESGLNPRRGFIRRTVGWRLEPLSDTEIQNLCVTVCLDHDVLRLDIAMNDACCVCDAQSSRYLRCESHCCAPSKRPLRKLMTQGLSFDEFSDNEVKLTVLADFINRDDVRVFECRNSVSFLLEASHALRVTGKLTREDLDGHVALELLVGRTPNFTHSALTKSLMNSIAAKLPPGKPLPLRLRHIFYDVLPGVFDHEGLDTLFV